MGLVSVVNACSEWAVITVRRDGKKFQLKWVKAKLLIILKTLLDRIPDKLGPRFNFYPDDTIFEGLHSEESASHFRL